MQGAKYYNFAEMFDLEFGKYNDTLESRGFGIVRYGKGNRDYFR